MSKVRLPQPFSRVAKLAVLSAVLIVVMVAIPILASASPSSAPVVSADPAAQSVHAGKSIDPVSISATDPALDLPFSVTSTWTRSGYPERDGMLPGLSLTDDVCTPDGGVVTCGWVLVGRPNVPIGLYVVTIFVTDNNGDTGSVEIEIAVTNRRPTAEAGGPYTVAEGSEIVLSGSGVDPDGDPLTYEWDLDNNGTFETPGQNPVFSTAGLDGPDTRTVMVQVCDEWGGCDRDSAEITITNAAPLASNNRPAQDVQYSDKIASVTVTGVDVPGDPLTVATTWTQGGGAAQPGLPAWLTLTAGACTPTGLKQSCVWTLSGTALAAPGAYAVKVTFDDGDGATASTDIAITVKQEDARVTYTGDLTGKTPTHWTDNATLNLAATVKDITAVDAVADPDAGDIRNATVTFVNRDTGATLCTSAVTLVSSADQKVGTAGCVGTVAITGKSQTFKIGIVVGGYYFRDAAADDTLVPVTRAFIKYFLPFEH